MDLKIFSAARLGFDELYEDAINFIQSKYKQSKQVFSLASPFGQLLTTQLGLGRLNLFMAEDLALEGNIITAQRDDSIRGLITLNGHIPTRAISAKGNASIRYNGNEIKMYGTTIILPKNLMITNDVTGITYLLQFNNKDMRFELSPNAEIHSGVIQGEIEAQKLTGTGKKLQSASFTVDTGINIENDEITVYVNNEVWAQDVSIYDMGYDEKSCIVKTGQTSGVDLFFGNTYNGMIPPDGAKIVLEYIKTLGEGGNLRMEDTYKFTFAESGYDLLGNEVDLNDAFEITLNTDISFGANNEPIALSKLLGTKISKSLLLGNPDNYITFFEKFNYFSIIDAFPEFDVNGNEENVIDILLVPDINKRLKTNEDYFTVPFDEFFLKENEKQKLSQLIEESGRRMTHLSNKFIDPVIKRYAVDINLAVFESYSHDSIVQEIHSVLSDFFLNLRRRDRVPQSDLISLIETIDGIDSVSLNFISEANENQQRIKPNAEIIGLNNFGDILINKDEIILIRGDWFDRYDRYISDDIHTDESSMVNISFEDDVIETYNSKKHQEYLKSKKH